MDFSQLNSLKFDFLSTNSSLPSLPSTLLDALIPGYGIFSQVIFRLLGFDIGLLVSGCLVVIGLSKGGQYFYSPAYGLFASYFMSSVQIEDDDQLFRQVVEWIAEQNMARVSRDLMAVTKWVSAYDDSDEEQNTKDEDVLDESGIFNYEKWASNIPPRCVGRSTEPIKELLNHIKKWTLTKEHKMTSVYRPAPKKDRRDCAWDRQSCRPSRPMSTVSLDQEQKAKIVMDMNEYLHPSSARWYAARGIPYRGGYLFCGPPGTGKTSLSFALAGIFGLDIYCISLMEVGLTESDLNKLFTTLPRRCIVLLEDIDSAGLRRTDDSLVAVDATDASSEGTPSEDGVKVDVTPKLPGGALHTRGIKSLISLSGLLNTIDGAASHEGRVLIMTTNHPEKLDPALIRPGRVDLQVQFTLATRSQTRDIYKRMYSTASETLKPAAPSKLSRPSTPTSKQPNLSSAREDEEFLELLTREPQYDAVDLKQLGNMAEEFASKIPEGTFSPAEIQGFLLTRKKEPIRALAEVEEWRDGELKRRREKGRA
ncbi:P-loop containing nucleoside triphosphate hydrolase protein [Bimuria novae-zelandiae CBS 107.79]|uniref:P-loop containing nucleoside triphosphate hydrolase protein n=1 Tax=Bimuria novae-zelandiae CBS 107.79 TaxID=1447943 RepID=A0A6A5UX34_9PLEO|nr:P-loop containing nucleoside triphosphate hydrolase protein [Bimuria novae-zelandiae CBS 107.79]